MYRTICSMFFMMVLCAVIHAQTISGTVTGTNHEPIADVRVSVPVLHRTVWTDANGMYHITGIKSGTYRVVFAKLGHAEESAPIVVSSDDRVYDAVLSVSPISMSSVTVTAPSGAASSLSGPDAISVLSGEELTLARNGSVMNAISWMPGVSVFTGGGQSVKPVVRGFTAQRIVTAYDGVRHIAQTWDEPQSAEIDGMDVDRIEVVHGPASLLYGPEAIGGVINVVREDLFQMSAPHAVDGKVLLDLNSGNTGAAASAAFQGAMDGYRYRATFTGRYAGDYSVPAGKNADGVSSGAGAVFNSGAEEFNAGLRIGRLEEWGTWQTEYSHFGQFYYISPEPGRKEFELNIHTGVYDSLPAAPRQEIIHERIGGRFTVPMRAGILDVSLTAQYNSRREEGVSESEEDEQLKKEKGIKPEAMLDLYSFSADARLHHTVAGIINGTGGGSFETERNQTLGTNAIIPAYTAMTTSIFLFEEVPIIRWLTLTGGVRYDQKGTSIRRNDSLRIRDAELTNKALNGSAAVVFTPIEHSAVVLNYSTGWRTPSASELYTYGKDEGIVRFKVGNPALVPELAKNIGLSLRYHSAAFRAEANIFRSDIQDYIFLDPAGTTLSGLPVYTYRQADATLKGGDLSAALSVTDELVLSASYDRLETKDTSANTALPLEPADRMMAAVQYRLMNGNTGMSEWSISSMTIMARTKHAFAQNAVARRERTTPAYTLFDVALFGDAVVAGRPVQYVLSGENLLNTAYYDHLSRYKEFALNPGIAVSLKLQTPFTILP